MNKKINYFFVALGLMLLFIYFYFRLILERLPKDISVFYHPFFIFSFTGIIIINLYRAEIFTPVLSKFNSNNKRITFLIEAYKKPFIELLHWMFRWKPMETIFIYSYRFLISYSIRFNYIFDKTYYFQYLTFNFIPRVIIAIALFIDLYNERFCYLYKVLPILIIPFLITLFFKSYINIFKEKFDIIYVHLFNYALIFEEDLDVLDDSLSIILEEPYEFFSYHTWVPEKDRDPEKADLVFSLYISVLSQIAYFKVGKEDPLFSTLNTCLYLILAFEWWYVLFHIILNI